MLQGLLRQLLHLLAQHQVSIVAVWLAAAMALISATDLQDDLDLGGCPRSLIRRQLQVAYRCQPDEFLEATACGKVKKVIDCEKGRYIAIYSASRGRSQSATECSRTEITNDTDCRVHCVVREVETMCLGKHRCSLSANDDRFGQACPLDATAQSKSSVLHIRYTCVRRAVVEELKNDNVTSRMNVHIDDPCPVEGHKSPPLNYRRRGQVTLTPLPSSSIRDPSSSSIVQESKQTNRGNAIKTRDGFVSTPAATSTMLIEADTATPVLHATADSSDGVIEDSVSVMEPRENSSSEAPSIFLRSISEWLWTWTFVRDNVEKSVLYLLCSLCFGIILLLVAVTIKMACCRRMSPSIKLDDNDPVQLADSVSSVKWRSPESESSTGDERTFQGDEDVEAVHGAHHHHHHNHYPRQGHSWHRGANSPSAPPAAVNRKSPGDISGAEGTALMKSRRVSDGEILPPKRQGTQSLPRGTAPHLWYNQDASERESPIAESAQTLQPTRHYNR